MDSKNSSTQRAGIVDLGSNTARLVVYAYRPGTWFRLIDQIREPIRLGEGMGKNRDLSAAAIDRAEAALELFSDFAKVRGLGKVEVIATSAVRDASNRQILLDRVAPLENLSMRILSGEDEAGLSVLAVANGFDLSAAWVVDLGGGSAQVSLMRDRTTAGGTSFPIGSVRLSERFLTKDPPKKKHIRNLEAMLDIELDDVARRIAETDLPIVAMGGTIRNLARACQRRTGYPLPLLHGYRLGRADLEALTDSLLSKSVAKRRRVSGLNPDRADVILAGALVFRWLLRASGRKELFISGYGLREGALFETFLKPPHLVENVRQFGLENVEEHFPQPTFHLDRVRFLARTLLEGLAPLHGLSPATGEILDAAAILHDIGMAVGYHRHHRHGRYLLYDTPLPGFSHREQVLIALLVRYHRKGTPSAGKTLHHLLEPGDDELLLVLTTCLRFAELLERGRAGRVQDVRVSIGKRKVTLAVVASEEPLIEMAETAKHADLFERAFGRRLKMKAAVEAA